MEEGFFIREGFRDIGVVTVGRFFDKQSRDDAFEKYFRNTGRIGFSKDKLSDD